LNCEEFTNLAEARWFARRRRVEHNEERPHSSLGFQTPSEFAAAQPKRESTTRYPTHTLITPWYKKWGTSKGFGPVSTTLNRLIKNDELWKAERNKTSACGETADAR
jgi:hypothetical protein